MAGVKRLHKEYRDLVKDPMVNCVAKPLEENLFEWRFIFKGESDTPYKDGVYMGKISLPKEYTWKPPKIQMITPNGRFRTNGALCLSFTHYHPESWNPALCIRTMLLGVISFFYDQDNTTGATKSTVDEKRLFAENSVSFNKTLDEYRLLFENNDLEPKKVVIIKKKKVAKLV